MSDLNKNIEREQMICYIYIDDDITNDDITTTSCDIYNFNKGMTDR